MPVTIQSLEEIHQDINANLRGRFPGIDLSPTKPVYKLGRVFSAVVQGLQKLISDAQANFFPQTADDDGKADWGETLNLPRKGPTAARGSDALRVFGSLASAVSVGDQLVSSGGLVFEVNENDTVGAGGYVDVDVISVDLGAQTRLQAGEKLTFVSPPAGIDSEAELQIDLTDGGEDQESSADYGDRLADRIGEGASGGNREDFRRWGLEVGWVRNVYVYPNRLGRGTVDVAALASGSGTARIPSASERTELLDYLKLLVAVHLEQNLRVLEVTTTQVDVDIQIRGTTDGPNVWDWDDTDGALVVDTWDAATRKITLTTDRPDDMFAGDRIVLSDISADDAARTGEQLVISALGAATDEIILAEDPPITPASGDLVYAGGDLTDAVRAQILAFFDSLGPVIGAYGIGNWIDEVDPIRLIAEAVRVDGVLKGTCTAPASVQTPSDTIFPLDTSVELLIPGEIIVRRLA